MSSADAAPEWVRNLRAKEAEVALTREEYLRLAAYHQYLRDQHLHRAAVNLAEAALLILAGVIFILAALTLR